MDGDFPDFFDFLGRKIHPIQKIRRIIIQIMIRLSVISATAEMQKGSRLQKKNQIDLCIRIFLVFSTYPFIGCIARDGSDR
jgi:hypothetical protein